MLVSIEVGEQRVAVLEDGQPVEVYLERPGRRSIAGNIYKGVVDNVLPGMEASFIDIGLEKDGFLYVDEIVVPELEGKQRHGRKIQELISRGQELLVQAVKDPMGTKGARLTTEVSLPGRFLVYTPFGDGIGVSRRLEDEERERLKAICKTLELPDGGIIVRTAAEGASEAELAGDLAFLQRLWATIQTRATRSPAPSLVYREAELPLRVVRDLFTREFEHLTIDHQPTHGRIVSYLNRTSPELADKVEWYRGAEPVMERFGVEAAVRSTLSRRVDLPSGGYLVFDYAEAFTVIDVNTGRFVGARGKGSGARLEDTITKNNLEATKEIVRQLRLRDIGGIIVIDFIDMANPKNRHEVEEALKREFERDRTKTYVVEISPLGLVEMTRQNVTDGPREILTTRCPICEGNGIVVSDETYAVEAERRLRQMTAASKAPAFLVELPSRVAGILIGPAGARLAELERATGRMFAFETSDDLPLDHVAVLVEGSVDEIEPQALPVVAGQELRVLLEEANLHAPEDAIARIDGYVVSVAGAAGKVGKRVSIRIERATRTAAYAVLAGAAPAAEAPVEAGVLAEEDEAAAPAKPRARRTAQRRAPKPAEVAPEPEAAVEAASVPAKPRARRTARPKAPAPAEAAPSAEAAKGEDAPAKPRAKRTGQRKAQTGTATTAAEEATTVEPADGVAESAGEDGEVVKKKTRRGSRGGRGRKKPVEEGKAEVEGAEAADAVEPVAGEPELGSVGPAEPEAAAAGEEADGDERPKRRTRRGSRGGRGRKKPASATGEETVVEPAGTAGSEVDGAPPAVAVDAGEPESGAAVDGADGAPRKRTRRGSRGGRGRRRPPSGDGAPAEVNGSPLEGLEEPAPASGETPSGAAAPDTVVRRGPRARSGAARDGSAAGPPAAVLPSVEASVPPGIP